MKTVLLAELAAYRGDRQVNEAYSAQFPVGVVGPGEAQTCEMLLKSE